MNQETENRRPANPRLINLTGFIIAALLFAAYACLYQFAPLDEPVYGFVFNAITPFAAALTAGVATAIYFHYHPEDSPRKIWLCLMVGSWLWFLGDAAWSALALSAPDGEVPTPSYADLFWLVGMAFFVVAFYYQYALVFPAYKRRVLSITVGGWLLAAAVPAIWLALNDSLEIGAYVDYYYPAVEILLGTAGILLVVAFQGGALVRPWVGMVIFSVSDFLYAWAEQSGLYDWSSDNNSLLTLGIDMSYLSAYLVLGLGFLGHWLLLKYGYGLRKKA